MLGQIGDDDLENVAMRRPLEIQHGQHSQGDSSCSLPRRCVSSAALSVDDINVDGKGKRTGAKRRLDGNDGYNDKIQTAIG